LDAPPFSGPNGQQLGDFPIVDSQDKRILVGSVKRTTLLRIAKAYRALEKQGRPIENPGFAKSVDLSKYQYYDTVTSSSYSTAEKKSPPPKRSLKDIYIAESESKDTGRDRPSDNSEKGLLEDEKEATEGTLEEKNVEGKDRLLPGNEVVSQEMQDSVGEVVTPEEHAAPVLGDENAAAYDIGHEQLCFSGLHQELLQNLSMYMTADGKVHHLEGGKNDGDNQDDAHVSMPESRYMLHGCTIRVDPAPFAVVELTPVSKIHFLFAIAAFAQIFVTREGKLVGTILKEDLTNEERLYNKTLGR
jgi:hypothetical protein